MQEEADGDFVHGVGFGKEQGFARETAQALAEGAFTAAAYPGAQGLSRKLRPAFTAFITLLTVDIFTMLARLLAAIV